MLETKIVKPRIVKIPKKKLVGKSMKMSLVNNLTGELWKSFMTERGAIKNIIGSDLYSLQIYDGIMDIENFDPAALFLKFAAIEVFDFTDVHKDFETLVLQGGLYAVFLHKGSAKDFSRTFKMIFYKWLPQSEYEIDDRPHFEVLGEKYKKDDPDSEEEVWIPIKKRVETL